MEDNTFLHSSLDSEELNESGTSLIMLRRARCSAVEYTDASFSCPSLLL
jgi:hypothetical protein